MTNKDSIDFIVISIVTHNVLLGQIGNMDAAITRLQHIFINAEMPDMVAEVEKVRIELQFFKDYFPLNNEDIPF